VEYLESKKPAYEAPHWEWRCFGIRGEELNRVLKHQLPFRMRTENEIYLLSAESPHNCKIRLDRKILKIKQLLEMNDLELWQASLRAPFPLLASDVKRLLNSLSITVESEIEARDNMEDFLDELQRKAPGIQAVPVAKTRMIYRLDSLELEFAKVRVAENETVFTFAAENPDAAPVRQFLQENGLMNQYRNQNYSVWLKSRLHHFLPKQSL
jgi:hypothetical protein